MCLVQLHSQADSAESGAHALPAAAEAPAGIVKSLEHLEIDPIVQFWLLHVYMRLRTVLETACNTINDSFMRHKL